MSIIDIKVPDIGDFKEVAVIEVLVKPGDTIKVEQSLITVESDKASMEIPSSHAGVVKELKVKLRDKVGEGTVVLSLEVAADAALGASASAAAASISSAEPMRTVISTRVTSRRTALSRLSKSSKASRLYSCFGSFCA